MQANGGCPSPESLKGLLDGALGPDEQSSIARHLETCSRCQQTLEAFVAGKQSWAGAKEQLAAGIGGVDPALAEAIEHAKQASPSETEGGHAASDSELLDFLKPSDEPGSVGRLGSYEIMQVVGRGGFGVVLKAFDSSLRRVVAIKVLSPQLASSSTARRRFVREARAAAAVNHDHVVAIHAVEESHEPPYFVMQFIEGKTLQERLDSAGPLSVTEILRIAMQATAGLAAAHDQGQVHRDIKPANILLENGVERVKITDFGLARTADDASLTQSGVVAGTPQFMAPEQASGESVDARADLFSLGSVLYAMCTGRPPFRASTTMGVLKRVCEESARPIREVNPEIPDWLEAIVAKLHAKEPADRYQSARELCELFAKCLAHVQQPTVNALPAMPGATAEPVGVGSTSDRQSIADRVIGTASFVLSLLWLGSIATLVMEFVGLVSADARSWTMTLIITISFSVLALGATTLWIWRRWERFASFASSSPYRIAVFFCLLLFFTGMFVLNGWVGGPREAVETRLPLENSSVALKSSAPSSMLHDDTDSGEPTTDAKTEIPGEDQDIRRKADMPQTSASSPKAVVTPVSDALVTAMRDLVAQRAEELNRMKKLHTAGAVSTDELLLTQKASFEALARLAKAEDKTDDAIRMYEQIVQICEKRVQHSERLYAAGSLTPSELTHVRAELAEARIQLEALR